MRQSILFFDIDGTLLSDKTGKIPDSALEALAEAKKNGQYGENGLCASERALSI